MPEQKGEIPLKCAICGSEFPEGSEFCPFCGTPVPPPTASAPTQPFTPPTAPEDPFTPPAPAPQPPLHEKAKKEKIRKEKAPKGKGWNPGPIARIFLRLGSVILSFLLSISLAATVLTVDMQLLTSESTVERVISSVLRERNGSQLSVLAKGSSDDQSITAELQDTLVDMIYDTLKQNDDENKITASKEQISEFLTRSDSDKFLSDKLSGLMEDLINGTENTHIRSADVIKLLDRNEDLAEEILGSEVNAQMKQDIKRFMDEKDIDRLIHKEIFPKIREFNVGGILSVSAALDFIRTLASPSILILLILLDIVLIGLLLLTHWLRIGATMRCVGTCFTSVGAFFALPTLVIQFGLLPLPEALLMLMQLLTSVVAVAHYALPIIGIVLLLSSLIVRIVELKTRR